MTSWWLFPPHTREVQLDEKWSFVGKKEKNCDRDDRGDDDQGECWDHVALDAEHRLVLSVWVGRRTPDMADFLLEEVYRRTQGRTPILLTSDEYPAYEEAIRSAYGVEVVPPRTGRPGRPAGPRRVLPEGLVYATVHKERANNRVVGVTARLVFGTEAGLAAALANSTVSVGVNTALVERHNGTDRHRSARKGRKTYRFSKDWEVHESMSYFTMYSYNFCWPVRTLRERDADGKPGPLRTPAMAAGLTDHVWSLREWVTLPAVERGGRRSDQASSPEQY
jgi:IS1 family transposase